MKIFPAVDILGGKAVRLTRGAYDSAKTYFDDPVRAASLMREAGAEYLHVVDLDGARSGRTDNFSLIERIVKQTSLKVEVGGGVRDTERVKAYLDSGAFRVILGTAAVKNYPFVLKAAAAFPGRVAVGVDAKDGFVAVEGWAEKSEMTAVDLARQFESAGVAAIIYTDVARDGVLQGPNLPATVRLARSVSTPVIVSGGISSLDDLKACKKEEQNNIAGVIAGRAVYDNRFTVREAVRLLKGE